MRGEKEGANIFLIKQFTERVFWMVKLLVPFHLNNFFKLNESKNGTQRLWNFQFNMKQYLHVKTGICR